MSFVHLPALTSRSLSALSLGTFFLVLAAAGGKAALVWHGAAALLLLGGLYVLLSGQGNLGLGSYSFLPGLAGFLGWGLISTFQAPCAYGAFLSQTKIWTALCFGLLVSLFWEDRWHRIFRGALLSVAGLQALLLMVFPLLKKPAPLLLPGNPQYAGLWLCAAALLALGEAFPASAPAAPTALSLRQKGMGALSLFLGLSLPLLPSRASLLALAAGLLLFLFRRWKTRGFLLGALAFVAVLALIPQSRWDGLLKANDPLAWKRKDIWLSALAGIGEKPFWGWGPGRFETLYQRHARPQESLPARFDRQTAFAHNDFLQAAAFFGVPALVFLLWGLAAFLTSPGAAPPRQAAVLAAAVISLFNFPFVLPVNGLLLAWLLGGDRPARAAAQVPWLVSTLARKAFIGVLALLALGNAGLFGLHLTGNADPWAPEALRREADRLIHPAAGEPPPQDADLAQRKLDRALRLCRSDAQAWRDLSHLRSSHAVPPRNEEAAAALQKALYWHPTNAPWFMELSRLLEKQGNLEGALRAARDALALEPGYLEADRQAGRLIRLQGRPAHAERWLTRLLRREEARPAPEESLSPYARQVLQADPEAVRREIAYCQMALKKYDEALATLSRNRNPTTEQWLQEAGIHYLMGRYDRAERLLRRALEKEPDNALLRRRYQQVAEKLSPKQRR